MYIVILESIENVFLMQIGNVKNTFYNEIIFENPIFHLLQENYEFVDNLYMYQLHTACLN